MLIFRKVTFILD